MESQGDALMRRKLERQAQHQQQLVAPSNEIPDPPAGRYFSSRRTNTNSESAEATITPRSNKAVAQAQDRLDAAAAHHNASTTSLPPLQGTPRGFAAVAMASMSASQSAAIPPYRRHLESRQREIESYIEDRVREAIEDQRIEEELRAEACRKQRDVERIKLRQRIKQRVELQASAKQPVPGALVEAMGLKSLVEDSHHNASAIVEHRKALRDVPTATFLAHNANRLSASAVHREACITAERLKAQVRVALEEYVGADFAKKRLTQWEEGDGRPTDSVRCPTASERHRHRTLSIEQRRKAEQEAEELKRSMAEVTRLDDMIWAAEGARLSAGVRRQLAKDVTFDTQANFRRRPSSKQARTLSV